MQTLLNVNNLSVNFDTTQGIFTAVDDVSFYINKGECLGIAGESGSGKTQTFFSITGILSDNGSVSGNAYFNNIDLLRLNEKEISKICRKVVKDLETKTKRKILLDKKSIQNYLGVEKYRNNEILTNLSYLKKYKDITMALISHDIAVISEVSESILVMNEGKIVEKGDCKKVLSSPNHEYTKHLLSCIPEWMK